MPTLWLVLCDSASPIEAAKLANNSKQQMLLNGAIRRDSIEYAFTSDLCVQCFGGHGEAVINSRLIVAPGQCVLLTVMEKVHTQRSSR